MKNPHPSGRPIDREPRPKDRPPQIHEEFRLPRLRSQKQDTRAIGFVHSFPFVEGDGECLIKN